MEKGSHTRPTLLISWRVPVGLRGGPPRGWFATRRTTQLTNSSRHLFGPLRLRFGAANLFINFEFSWVSLSALVSRRHPGDEVKVEGTVRICAMARGYRQLGSWRVGAVVGWTKGRERSSPGTLDSAVFGGHFDTLSFEEEEDTNLLRAEGFRLFWAPEGGDEISYWVSLIGWTKEQPWFR